MSFEETNVYVIFALCKLPQNIYVDGIFRHFRETFRRGNTFHGNFSVS